MIYWNLKLNIIWLFCLCHSLETITGDVYSCGGFVKSSVPISYEKILVRLYTPEGNLKYETDCAPNNGYYMIPVYAKGTYSIRVIPPKGWSFEPESVDLTVDGQTDPCSTGMDINFEFGGFSVTGQVRSGRDSLVGPNNFRLSLFNEKQELQSTRTTAHGHYEFNRVLPGRYYVSGSDEGGECVARGSAPVTVSDDRVIVDKDLVISGYSVLGMVRDGKGNPVADVLVSLFGTGTELLPDCKSASSPPEEEEAQRMSASINEQLKFLCSTTSNERGHFQFRCIPPGAYSLVPSYSRSDVHFELAPKLLEISVGSGPVTIDKPFEISGFSVSGRVSVGGESRTGINGVTITVNGQETKTNPDGVYSLTGITSGRHSIEAALTDYSFEPIHVELSPTNVKIPEIVAKGFAMCGIVRFENIPESVPKLPYRTLLLTSDGKKEGNTVSVKTDDQGQFCTMVVPGKYKLSPNLLREEKEAGLVLIPSVMDVDMTGGPVKNLLFNQFEATISGDIQCLEPCRKMTVLELTDSYGSKIKSLHLSDKLLVQNYEIKGLLPGTYNLTISDDFYCWEKSSYELIVGKRDISGNNFRQTGFLVNILSTSETTLIWTWTGKTVVHGRESLKVGLNQFCVPVAGKYELTTESCHKFQRDKYEYETAGADQQLSLVALKHLVSGNVFVPRKSPNQSMPISVGVRTSSLTASTDTNDDQDYILGPLKASEEQKDGHIRYPFYFYAVSNSVLHFTPLSDTFLFEPIKWQLSVEETCLHDAVKFVGEEGIFLEGEIQPPIADVFIKMTHITDPSTFYTATTDPNGKYKIGPLRTFKDFSLTAEKFGYAFSQSTTDTDNEKHFGHLKAVKLAQLKIDTLTVQEKEGAGDRALAGVLVSLSGGAENYRSNNLTDQSGTISFLGLSPGDYFIRPILKEYSFEPTTKSVTMREGEAETVQLFGKRVAFSCLGQVRHLGGQAVSHLRVEAVSESCNQLHEEDVTDLEGKYRLRGLQPGCVYRLAVTDHQFGSPYPNFYNVKVSSEDIIDRDFVLRPLQTWMEIEGRVVIPDDVPLSSMKIHLFREDSLVQTLQLQYASMFHFQDVTIDDAVYIVRLETSLAQNHYEPFDLPQITFRANSTFQFLTLTFQPKKRSVEVEISKTSYIALPMAILIVILGYNYALVLPFAQEKVVKLGDFLLPLIASRRQIGRISPQQQTTAEDVPDETGTDSVGPSSLKRRQKLRKT